MDAVVKQVLQTWQSVWDYTALNNHGRTNTYAAATLMVTTIFAPEDIPELADQLLPQPLAAAVPAVIKKDRDKIVSLIVRQLQRLPVPMATPQTLSILERMTDQGPTRVWTNGDITPPLHHSLPRQLFGDTLPGSLEQINLLRNAGVLELKRSLGRGRLGIEVHDDKVVELPRIVEELLEDGCRSVFVLDSEAASLEAVDELFADNASLPIHLIWVGSGKLPPISSPILISQSLIHYYYVINNIDEGLSLIDRQALALKPAILCGFNGVIANNRALRKRQEMAVCQIILQALFKTKKAPLGSHIGDDRRGLFFG